MKPNPTNTAPLEHEVFDIITGLEELTLTARKLKAITTAFAETFADCPEGADLDEISARREMFGYLFDALRDYVCNVEEQTAILENKTELYVYMKRQAQADS